MDLIFGMLFSFIALIWAVYKNIFIGLPLVFNTIYFCFSGLEKRIYLKRNCANVLLRWEKVFSGA